MFPGRAISKVTNHKVSPGVLLAAQETIVMPQISFAVFLGICSSEKKVLKVVL